MPLFRSVNNDSSPPFQGTQPLTSRAIVDVFAPSEFNGSKAVDENSVKGIAAVIRCVEVISGAVTSIEKSVVTKSTGKPNNAQSKILYEPHPLFDEASFFSMMMESLLLRHGFTAYKFGDKGSVTSLYPFHPDLVSVRPVIRREGNKQTMIDRLFVVTIGGTEYGLTEEEVFYIPGIGFDGLTGESVISRARRVFSNAINTDQYAADFYGNGSLISGILTTDKRLEETQAEGLKQRWRKKVQGINNAHDIVVLDSGTQFMPISVNPEDSQFIEAREFNVLEIGRIFGVDPALLFAQSDPNAEQTAINFIQFTMNPWYRRIASAYERQILKASNKLVFHKETLIMPDLRTRSSASVMWRNAKIKSINEIRAEEGLPPLADEGADDPLSDVGSTTGQGAATPGGNAGNLGSVDPDSESGTEPDPDIDSGSN